LESFYLNRFIVIETLINGDGDAEDTVYGTFRDGDAAEAFCERRRAQVRPELSPSWEIDAMHDPEKIWEPCGGDASCCGVPQ
jgi:hypothetical protein